MAWAYGEGGPRAAGCGVETDTDTDTELAAGNKGGVKWSYYYGFGLASAGKE